MEDFFYFNVSKNENLKKEINNILIYLDEVNKKIKYTKINIREREGELLKFLLSKFKKLYLFQFMINPNEDIENAFNNSLILLFNEISNNLNYNSNNDSNSNNDTNVNYIDILKNKSIYKFLEELEENKDNYYNSTTRRLIELNQLDIDYLKSAVITNNEHISSLTHKIKNIAKNNYIQSCSCLFLVSVFVSYKLYQLK